MEEEIEKEKVVHLLEEQKEDSEEVVKEVDKGEMLVLSTALSDLKAKEE